MHPIGAAAIVLAAVLGLAPMPDAHARGWAVRVPDTGMNGAFATLATTETWAVRAPTGRRALATLTLRCRPGSGLGASVAFPGLTSGRELWIRYAFGGHGRHARRVAPEAGRGLSAWLGGSDLVRDLAAAEVLEVAIDDPAFGLSEAVFRLAGAGEAVRRVREACRAPSATGSRTPQARGAKAGPRRNTASRNAVDRAAPEQRKQPPTGRLGPTPPEAEPNLAAEPPVTVPSPSDRPAPVKEPPARPESAESKESSETPSPPPKTEEGAKVGPGADTGPEEPGPAEPPRGDGTPEGRLAAFLHKYGPNRQGELIYGWYRQCLEAAGIDRARVWYLSNEELAYLSKGETDQVRLSMLVSTVHSLDVPPRRVVCHGTARGRDLTIDRAE